MRVVPASALPRGSLQYSQSSNFGYPDTNLTDSTFGQVCGEVTIGVPNHPIIAAQSKTSVVRASTTVASGARAVLSGEMTYKEAAGLRISAELEA